MAKMCRYCNGHPLAPLMLRDVLTCGRQLDNERLKHLAVMLSAEHEATARPRRSRSRLLELEEQARQLERFRHECLSDTIDCGSPTPAVTEWLKDRLPVLDEHLLRIRQEPRGNYDRLPVLKAGDLAGFPRIYAAAACLAADLDYRLEIEALKEFILAYQCVTPLLPGELEALAVSLRLVLLENLQCLITRIATSQIASEVAGSRLDSLADLQATAEHIFAGLRLIATLNWPVFLESAGPVHLALCGDPTGIYPSMELATRNSYRRVVERLARQSKMAARDVAQRAVELASEWRTAHPNEEDLGHVGYYLVDAGRATLEAAVGYQPPWHERFWRALRGRPALLWFGLLAFLTVPILALFIHHASQAGASTLMLASLFVLLVTPANELALHIMDILSIFMPTSLPKMDYSCGVPEERRTMVVIPTIFSSETAVRELLETIEAHYLANQDHQIFFALLGDWSDAPQEKMPEDDALLDLAMSGIRELNACHNRGGHDRFFLFHRRRQWNPGEERWMGWERKPGKLREFNRLLRGAGDTSYIVATADQNFLARIRYVITLDSDTQLPRDAARRLIGTIAHPLNRPKIDESTRRVRRGYVIIQPNVGNLVARLSRSRIPDTLPNFIGDHSGVTEIPDLHQNLLGEGLYIGKGLYDVDAFEVALKDRVPENLLSHDVYEGLYARTAVATDIQVLEVSDPFYESAMKTQHRWTRGDWQNLPWLLPSVRNAHGRKVRNTLPVIARWKILSPLQRSLSLPAMLFWLAAAWTVFPGSSASWTLLILASSASYVFLQIVKWVLLTSPHRNFKTGFWGGLKSAVKLGGLCLGSLVRGTIRLVIFMPHHSYIMGDAIIRTLYRMFISRRHLLEWSTAAQNRKQNRHDLLAFIRLMWPVMAMALVIAALIVIIRPAAMAPAAPFLLAWLASPLIAYWFNRLIGEHHQIFEAEGERRIRLKGRRIWREVERSVEEEDQGPSPDLPRAGLKFPASDSRISTNCLRLPLWMVTAYDLGCIGTVELAERLDLAFARIAKYRACHDNGLRYQLPSLPHLLAAENYNPAGHLSTFKQVCIEITNRRLFDERLLKGFIDTVSLLNEEMAPLGRESSTKVAALYRRLREEIEACTALLSSPGAGAPATLTAWRRLLDSLARHAAVINESLKLLHPDHSAVNRELCLGADSFIRQTRDFSRDLQMLAPWIAASATALQIIGEHDAVKSGEWAHLTELLDQVPIIWHLPETTGTMLTELGALRPKICRGRPVTGGECARVLSEFDNLVSAVEGGRVFSKDLLSRYAQIAQESEETVKIMDFQGLFDEERKALRMNWQHSSFCELTRSYCNC
ncbi:MAG TPA: hypothetical protein VJ302_38620 [Blastocatellia bacterium]|nr:hypothetical protein [Blastocatellia bacterium]